jgi:hypothetical protein
MKQVINGKCPVCGGTSFVTKRTKKGVVAAGLLAPKRVRCVSCGESLHAGSGISTPTPAVRPEVREAVAAARVKLDAEVERRTAAGDPPPRGPRLMTAKSMKKHAEARAEWLARGRAKDSQSGGSTEEHREAPVTAPAAISQQPDVPDQLRKLAELRDAGVITEDEFSAKKADMLSRI